MAAVLRPGPEVVPRERVPDALVIEAMRASFWRPGDPPARVTQSEMDERLQWLEAHAGGEAFVELRRLEWLATADASGARERLSALRWEELRPANLTEDEELARLAVLGRLASNPAVWSSALDKIAARLTPTDPRWHDAMSVRYERRVEIDDWVGARNCAEEYRARQWPWNEEWLNRLAHAELALGRERAAYDAASATVQIHTSGSAKLLTAIRLGELPEPSPNVDELVLFERALAALDGEGALRLLSDARGPSPEQVLRLARVCLFDLGDLGLAEECLGLGFRVGLTGPWVPYAQALHAHLGALRGAEDPASAANPTLSLLGSPSSASRVRVIVWMLSLPSFSGTMSLHEALTADLIRLDEPSWRLAVLSDLDRVPTGALANVSMARFPLGYCIDKASFGANYDTVVAAVTTATRQWSEICNVTFEHASDLDAEPGIAPTADLFVVRYVSASRPIAAAFFPGYEAERRVLRICEPYFADDMPFDRVGVLRHELGHVLGFRHEHIRPEASGPPHAEPTLSTKPLGDYDKRSVMHYLWREAGSKTLAFTDKDRFHAHQMYPWPDGRGATANPYATASD